jgi:hypothetical protein
LQQFCFGNDFSGGGCRLPAFRWPVGLRHLRAGGLFSLTPGAASLPNGLTHLHLGIVAIDPCNKNRFACGIAAWKWDIRLISRSATSAGRCVCKP